MKFMMKLSILLRNLIFKIKNFLLLKNNNELISKTFIESIKNKIIKPNYIEFGQKVYSQNDEDGIINEIFNDIGINNKIFIEIGIGDGCENNTHNLVLNNWRGVWIDNNKKIVNKLIKYFPINKKLFISCATVKPENINSIIKSQLEKSNLLSKLESKNNEIDFLSIDIDSYDIDCIEKLDIVLPRLICIEYNGKFLKNHSIKTKLVNKSWEYDDYFGSSLSYINQVMQSKNYNLVSTNISGINAFYVKKDLFKKCKTFGQDISDLYMPPNYNLYDYYVSHYPTMKFLKDFLDSENK